MKFQTFESIKRVINILKEDDISFNEEGKIEYYFTKSEEYFKLIIDINLLSFEKCLIYFIEKINKNESFPLVSLFKNLKTDLYWKGFELPFNFEEEWKKDYLLLFVCLWRINTSKFIEKELFGYYYSDSSSSLLCYDSLYKSSSSPQKVRGEFYNSQNNYIYEYLRYNFLLFRDTHLGLLTIMIKKQIFKDINIVYNGILRSNYPSSFNICCVEELPDLSFLLPLMNLWYDKGTKREVAEEEIDALRHIFSLKPMNQICMVRNISVMIKDFNQKYPIVLELFKLTMKCVLLGNLPYAKNPLDFMARIHFNSMFDNNFNSNIFPSSQDSRSINEKILGWINRCKYFTIFIIRELLFYTCEQNVLDNILSRNTKWNAFKELSRYGNGDVRKELSIQCHQKGSPEINWNNIEYRTTTSKNSIERKTGILKGYHTQTLEYADKLFKAEFEKILPKKMRAIEPLLNLNTLYYWVNHDDCKYQTSFLPDNSPLFQGKKKMDRNYSKDKFYLNFEEFHFLCWYIVNQQKPILDVKWLQLLNISDKGLFTIKNWILSYYEFSIADNSFKRYALNLYRKNPIDYLILKSFIKTIDHYKNNKFYLPYEDTLYQFDAIRKTLRLEEWESTPPKAGYCLLCLGCHRWANKITESYEKILLKKKKKLDMDLDNELANIILALENDDDDEDSNEEESQQQQQEEEKDDFDKLLDQSNQKYSKNKKNLQKKRKIKGKGRINRNGCATYLSTALYDPTKTPDEGCLYCKRGNYSREYIVEDRTEIKKENNEYKNNLKSFFKGFYDPSYYMESEEENSESTGMVQDLPDFDNIKIKQEVEELDFTKNFLDSDENDYSDDNDETIKKKNSKEYDEDEDDDDIIYDEIDPELISGNIDLTLISENIKQFQSFQNIKIPNIILNKSNNTLYGYINLKNNNNQEEYDDNGYPIEYISITNKLEKRIDGTFIFKSISNQDKIINEYDNTMVSIKKINQIRDNKLYYIPDLNNNNNNTKSDSNNVPEGMTITIIVNHLISQKFNCYNQLENIDLVGIYYKHKGVTNALCTFCGCFIKVCNKNFCNRGISCGRHATSSHRFDHILWQLDKDVPLELKIEYAQKNKCIQTKKDEIYYALTNSSQQKLFKNRRFISMFDYRDITPKLHYFADAWCYFCNILNLKTKSVVYLKAFNFVFKIIKIPLCKSHAKQCRYKYTKKAILFLIELEHCIYIINKI